MLILGKSVGCSFATIPTITKNGGYSLIEPVITITLTSIVMTIFFTVFSQNQVKSVSPVMQIKALELGQAYLEEISLKRYDENSPADNSQVEGDIDSAVKNVVNNALSVIECQEQLCIFKMR